MEASSIARIGDESAWVEIAADGPRTSGGEHPTLVRFYKGGLSGEFRLGLVCVEEFVAQLRAMHRTLKGEATLADEGIFSLQFRMNLMGKIEASVWINSICAFGIDGLIEFDIRLDQTFLPSIWQRIESAFDLATMARP